MYPVILGKTVKVKDGSLDMRREIELPFAPFIGLEIEWDSDLYSDAIASVTYKYDEKQFFCWVDNANYCEWEISEASEEYRQDGWQIWDKAKADFV
jgi:hypothetical protein